MVCEQFFPLCRSVFCEGDKVEWIEADKAGLGGRRRSVSSVCSGFPERMDRTASESRNAEVYLGASDKEVRGHVDIC